MHLVTHKIVPPSTFPTIPASRIGQYVYQLGISFCPSMDLVATYPILTRTTSAQNKSGHVDEFESDDDKPETKAYSGQHAYPDLDEETVIVDVWRFNGQRVFSMAIEDEDGSKVEVRSIKWRSDGQVLAILSQDDTIRLVNTFSGKVIHRFSSATTYAAPVSPTSPRTRRSIARSSQISSKPKSSALSYTTHFSDQSATQSLLHKAQSEKSVTLDDLLGLHADVTSLLQSPADLPRELANIDVESFLPRLSCLPPVGFGGEDVFSTRTSIDAIFHSSKKTVQSGIMDVLIAGSKDATLAVRIFNSFELGGVDLNSATGLRKTPRMGRVLNLASWPFTSEIFVLAEDVNRASLHLLSLDFKFMSHVSNTLPILATKATQLQNLMRYLNQIQVQLAREVKAAFDLPTRYLRNANEDIEAQDGSGASFVTASYHAIVMGEVSGAFKAWLNEQVGERGVKRWEKGVGDCLELVRRLISEAWCPAVERAGVVISRLSGLAGTSVKSDTDVPDLGLDRKLVERLRDTVDVMAVWGEECLKGVITEIGGFTAFIKWLKWEVEASALEDTSERLDEMREGSDHGEMIQVLEYIERGPQRSVVETYLGATAGLAFVDTEDDPDFYATVMEQRRRGGTNAQLPSFDQLQKRLRKQCDELFEQIARNLQKGIMTRYVTQLAPEGTKAVMDMRAIPLSSNQSEQSQIQIHIVAQKTNEKAAILHQVAEIGENQAKTGIMSSQVLHLPESEEIMDIKFVDDEYFMVLGRGLDKICIYSRHIRAGKGDEWELRHEFEAGVMESGMKPASLEINGRKKRRVVGVVDEDARGYVVFDLDSGDGERDATEADDETMTG